MANSVERGSNLRIMPNEEVALLRQRDVAIISARTLIHGYAFASCGTGWQPELVSHCWLGLQMRWQRMTTGDKLSTLSRCVTKKIQSHCSERMERISPPQTTRDQCLYILRQWRSVRRRCYVTAVGARMKAVAVEEAALPVMCRGLPLLHIAKD